MSAPADTRAPDESKISPEDAKVIGPCPPDSLWEALASVGLNIDKEKNTLRRKKSIRMGECKNQSSQILGRFQLYKFDGRVSTPPYRNYGAQDTNVGDPKKRYRNPFEYEKRVGK